MGKIAFLIVSMFLIGKTAFSIDERLNATSIDCSDFNRDGIEPKITAVYLSVASALIDNEAGQQIGSDCFYIGQFILKLDQLKNKRLWLTPGFDLLKFRENFEFKISSYCFEQAYSPLKEMFANAQKLTEVGLELKRFLEKERNLPVEHPCRRM